jgi:hypothetical protein
MKSTFTAVLWFYDDEKLEERRREILEEIRRNMTPGQRARFNSPALAARPSVIEQAPAGSASSIFRGIISSRSQAHRPRHWGQAEANSRWEKTPWGV